MKILLMVPLPSLIEQPPIIPDLGLAYLATALRKAKQSIYLLDWQNRLTPKDFLAYLATINPDVVGIKVFTKDIVAAIETLSLIKSYNPSIISILGGPHPSASSAKELMEDFELCDFAFRGEAEQSLPLLIERLNARDSRCFSEYLVDIPGLIWRSGEEIKENPPQWSTDLDSLGSPSWDLIDPRQYRIIPMAGFRSKGYVAPLAVSRGCPGDCIFCGAYHVSGKRVRTHSPDYVIQEIIYLYKKFGVRELMITDTNFLYYRDLVEEICLNIIKHKLNLKFHCPTGPYLELLDPSLLTLLKEAGCYFIGLGIESGSERIRQRIKKNIPLEKIRNLVSLINDHSIKVPGYFLFGFPGEEKEDLEKSIDFALSLNFEFLAFDICYPLPGTEIYQFLKHKHGIERIDWKTFNPYHSPYPISELSSAELYKLLKQVKRKLSLQPKQLYKNLQKGLNLFRIKLSGH